MSAASEPRPALQSLDGGKPDFFDGARFVPRRLAEHLREEAPLAIGGEALFVYRDGVYRAGGEEWVRSRITEQLGDRWKQSCSNEVVAYLRDSSPRLWESPPMDRINCKNGLVDLETRELGPHDPEFLSPIQLGADFDPDARSPATEQFVCEVLPEDSVQLFYQLAGYLIVPDNRLQTAAMFLGGGANGKSTALAVLTALLGTENVSAVPLHSLEEGRFAVAELYGVLANVFADLDSRALLSSSMFKAVTGGDLVTGERKYGQPFKFRPYARLLFSANDAPPTSDSSDAFFRRWLILPFPNTFEDGGRNHNLLARLTTPQELSGLLNLALAELLGLSDRGRFTSTDSTTEAAERFRVDSDSVAGFLEERCSLDPLEEQSRPQLFKAYEAWCKQNNRRSLSTQKFAKRLERLVPDHAAKKIKGVSYVVGVSLNREQA